MRNQHVQRHQMNNLNLQCCAFPAPPLADDLRFSFDGFGIKTTSTGIKTPSRWMLTTFDG